MQYLYLLQYERRFDDRVLDSGSKAGCMTLLSAESFESEVEEIKQSLKSGPYDSQLKKSWTV